MANRRLNQFRYSYERDVVDLMVKISIGAAGAPTISEGKGILSVVHNSAGNYSVNLVDNFNMLLNADINVISSTAPAAPLMNVASEQVSSSTAPRIVIQSRNAAGTATDPGSGEVLLVLIQCRNAST